MIVLRFFVVLQCLKICINLKIRKIVVNLIYNRFYSQGLGRKYFNKYNVYCFLRMFIRLDRNIRYVFFLMNRCYGRVLKLLSECVQLWYDLGFNLYQQSLYSEDENVVGVVEKLVEVFKKGLFLEFVNYQIWNIFGFVYCYSGEILEEIMIIL